VGYFYEQRGADWGYNLGTHHSNIWMVWHYARGTELGRLVIEEERGFAEWLAYNAVPEPDGSGFTLNRGIETRQKKPFLDSLSLRRGQEAQGQRLIGSEVELARAFLPTREEVARDTASRRAQLERSWPRTAELEPGSFSTFSPYAFLHRTHGSWYPTEAERQVAQKSLPSSKPPFVHQRMDSRQPVVFTYVRQPAYYAAFNSGLRLTPQQRYGIGLVWHPQAGSVLQSQTASREAAWGTAAAEGAEVYEADTLTAEFALDGAPMAAQPGKRDLPRGALQIRYPLADRGEKTLRFEEQEIVVSVQHAGTFREQIPLLVSGDDSLRVEPTSVSLTRGGKNVSVSFDESAVAEAVATGLSVGPRRVVTLVLRCRDRLTYRLGFSAR
jgi:hypothetical protein